MNELGTDLGPTLSAAFLGDLIYTFIYPPQERPFVDIMNTGEIQIHCRTVAYLISTNNADLSKYTVALRIL